VNPRALLPLRHGLTDFLCSGKSSLTVQFVENHFVESYYPTIENTFSKTIKYKGQEYTTEIIDTAGQVCPVSPFTLIGLRMSIVF